MPRGYLSLSTLGEGSFEALRLACDSAAKPSHVHDFIDIKSLGMAFLNAGLTDPVVDVERVNLSYRSWTRFHKDMKAMGMINTRKDRARTLTGAYAYRQWMNRLEATDSTPLRIQLELLFAQGFKSTGLPPKRVSRTEQVLPFPKRGRL
jgi:malonyl-CoA O-methyltransferase